MSKDQKGKRHPIDVSMFGGSTGMADVQLLVDGESIPVSKAVLGIASPVFRAMFQGDFKEKNQHEVPLPGKKIDDVLTLLRCIYPDIMLPITGSVAFTVLPLSEEYQMMSLKSQCEAALLQTLYQNFDDFYMNDFAYLYKFLFVSVQFNLQRLAKYCVSLSADFTQDERNTCIFRRNLPADVVEKIDELAISRLEVKNNDMTAMVSEMTRTELPEDVIKKYFRTHQYLDAQQICDHMRGLRLAYHFEQFRDIQKRARSTIRYDKESEAWSHDEEYKLLPEPIKFDINIYIE